MSVSVTPDGDVTRNAESEAQLFPFLQERLRLQRARQRPAARPSGGEPVRDPRETFENTGINVGRLKTLEAESIGHRITRPRAKPRSAAELQNRREKLLHTVPADRIFKGSSKFKPPAPEPQPNDVPSGVFADGTVFVADLEVQGSGLGWADSDSQARSIAAQWAFEFVPPQDGMYLITSFPAAWGTVFGHANDRWWNSKEFHLELSCGIGAEQPSDGTIKTNEFDFSFWVDPASQVMFDSDHGNFTLTGDIDCPEEIQQPVFFRGGVPAVIGCYIFVAAYAQGAGSSAAVDVSLGNLFTSWQLMEQ